jgi:5-oxoprolinase (ATP-hydrolysing)
VEAVAAGERRRRAGRRGARPTRGAPSPTPECACTADSWLDAGLYVREVAAARRHHRRPGHHCREATPPPWSNPAGRPCSPPPARSSWHACAARHAARHRHRADPVMLEVFNNLFMNIAEQMGLRLQNTAYSVNIKERLDFSCALFDADGELIANAPHMPVHLGSMSESIRTVIARNPVMQPGDVYVLNDPYHGGTHLPDVTVVTPVYLNQGDARSRPASTSPAAATMPTSAAARRARCRRSPRPSTRKACCSTTSCWCATAGCASPNCARSWRPGATRRATRPDHGRPARADRRQREGRAGAAGDGGAVRPRHVAAYMRHVQDNAEESVRRVITALKDGASSCRWTTAPSSVCKVTVDAAGARPPSTSPAPARSCRTTSTRPRR